MENLTHDQRLIGLLRETKRICEQNRVKYFLIGGSLRGAITRKGCIPGDADIDIGMLRSDYIHFLNCLDELASGYRAQTHMSDASFKETFTKIFDDTGSAYVDIQPFDNATENKILQLFHWLLFKVSRRLAMVFQSANLGLCADFFLKAQKKTQEFFNQRESSSVVSLNSRHGYKECFTKADIEELSGVVFEGITCPAPRNPNVYLAKVYGEAAFPEFQLGKEQLVMLQKCHLDLLCELKRICEKNDIQYFITDGTLLGAIKYKRAIPWDDDADVGMLKVDYDRFVRVCERDLGNGYCLNNYNTEPKYGNSFAELCIRNTICHKSTDPEYSSGRNGIFIDIHPFINIPENKVAQWIFSRECKFYKVALMLKCGYSFRSASRQAQYITGLFPRLCSKEFIVGRIERLATRYRGTKMAAQVFGQRYARNNIYVANIDKLVQVEYDKFYFPAQPDYDRILKAVYGENYMDPIEQDAVEYILKSADVASSTLTNHPTLLLDIQGSRHGITRLDFGNYQND